MKSAVTVMRFFVTSAHARSTVGCRLGERRPELVRDVRVGQLRDLGQVDPRDAEVVEDRVHGGEQVERVELAGTLAGAQLPDRRTEVEAERADLLLEAGLHDADGVGGDVEVAHGGHEGSGRGPGSSWPSGPMTTPGSVRPGHEAPVDDGGERAAVVAHGRKGDGRCRGRGGDRVGAGGEVGQVHPPVRARGPRSSTPPRYLVGAGQAHHAADEPLGGRAGAHVRIDPTRSPIPSSRASSSRSRSASGP